MVFGYMFLAFWCNKLYYNHDGRRMNLDFLLKQCDDLDDRRICMQICVEY